MTCPPFNNLSPFSCWHRIAVCIGREIRASESPEELRKCRWILGDVRQEKGPGVAYWTRRGRGASIGAADLRRDWARDDLWTGHSSLCSLVMDAERSS
jgi:hypothetical protein